MKIFVTGTDTDIGKTIISSWLCLHFNYHYWKPIQSGSIPLTDKEFAQQLGINTIQEYARITQPLSPHLAARLDNKVLDINKIQVPLLEPLIVEGAGGVLVPINEQHTILDLIQHLNLPVIVVARSTLGTINHTCLTLGALANRNIKVLGVIMNGDKNEENKKAIEYYGNTKVLQEFPKIEEINKSSLLAIKPSPALLSLFS
ncbi:MAG: dethiobiotin synthase [Candidatus Midichloria sp.]|uniref:Dethiobiotin synthase n=1 Tax=Hyalomma marginatum TaxID=34627 RepID=A0A8S4C268_9ACAR|nr:dethiobiotin synthase [Hyalomma marginatum]CAG7598990.1 dethiobiotin synthase [Hyalomma marginatum]